MSKFKLIFIDRAELKWVSLFHWINAFTQLKQDIIIVRNMECLATIFIFEFLHLTKSKLCRIGYKDSIDTKNTKNGKIERGPIFEAIEIVKRPKRLLFFLYLKVTYSTHNFRMVLKINFLVLLTLFFILFFKVKNIFTGCNQRLRRHMFFGNIFKIYVL